MATAVTPAALNRASISCTCAASGVVPSAGASAPGRPWPSVPMIAVRRPHRSRHWAIHCAHDVLPLVPVTPTIHSDCDGRP